jgi:hypothetical protein
MSTLCDDVSSEKSDEIDESSMESNIYYVLPLHDDDEARKAGNKNISALPEAAAVTKTKKRNKNKKKKNKNSAFNDAVQVAALEGLNAMIELYERKEPEMIKKGQQRSMKFEF